MFWSAQKHFNGVREYKDQVAELHEDLQRERLKLQLANDEYLDFRQTVATLMPKALAIPGQKNDTTYQLRNLASVLTPVGPEAVKALISKTLFERGQQLFRDKKFVESNKVFKKFVDTYSYSVHTPEAYFLWLDGAYQLGNYTECVELSRQMIEQFPGTELTGFALLRLGRIYERQGRAGDAVDIYKTVIRSYPQKDVTAQARHSLKGLDL